MKYLDYVNIKQGTYNHSTFSSGNILPVVGMPFGMSSFVLENDAPAGAWFFNPMSKVTTGIRLSHQPSPWVGDYGQFTMMAASGDKVYFNEARHSGYRPSETVMTPYYINLRFLLYRSNFELVPTLRGAAGRIIWDVTDKTQRFVLCNADKEAQLRIDTENRRLYGYTRANVESVPDNFAEYFVFEFDRDFDLGKTIMSDCDGEVSSIDGTVTSNGLSISLAFANDGKNEANIKMVTSFIGYEQLELNFNAELKNKTFEDLKKNAKREWEKHLSKIEIETEDVEQMKTFYSCLYRMFLFPRVFYEYDASGKPVHYNTADGTVREGVMYTDNGFWDTYKTVYPLYSIILSDRYEELTDAFLNYYKDSGWLPKWLSPGERGYMPGTMIDPIMADAVIKGVVTDKAKIELMLEGMIKHANIKSEDPVHGREGIEEFVSRGYVTSGVKENVNKTLDYSYEDFCIARIAKHLGKDDIAEEYFKRSKNYLNILDVKEGLMRSRDENGKMRDDWTSFDWGWDYCEGSAWQNSFAVFHDLLGMAKEMGGRDKMIAKINELFATPPYYNPYGYPCEIHEMTEMAAVDFGQCALSNQPSFHIPYIYSCMGDKDKTAFWVRKAAAELFDSSETGYPGDEDNGSMAGWYVFSTMGFYPVCPGAAQYVLGSPGVKKCVIHTDKGTDYVIEAPANSSENIYIESLFENTVELHRTYISHKDIKKGGKLVINMQSKPKKEEYSIDSLPYSVVKDQ